MLNRFFELFAFEKISASSKAPEELYSKEVIDILNDRQRIFFKLNVKEITTQEYMDMFDISRNTAVKRFKSVNGTKFH